MCHASDCVCDGFTVRENRRFNVINFIELALAYLHKHVFVNCTYACGERFIASVTLVSSSYYI